VSSKLLEKSKAGYLISQSLITPLGDYIPPENNSTHTRNIHKTIIHHGEIYRKQDEKEGPVCWCFYLVRSVQNESRWQGIPEIIDHGPPSIHPPSSFFPPSFLLLRHSTRLLFAAVDALVRWLVGSAPFFFSKPNSN
jgi:hypothetical protein